MAKSSIMSEFVNVAPRFLRSVNLSNDWDNTSSTSGYIVTPTVIQALEQITEGALEKNGQKAFALTGPYGTGKSAFAVFLCQLLSCNAKQANSALALVRDDNNKLARQIKKLRVPRKEASGFLFIPVTARRRPIAQLLIEGMVEAAKELRKTKSSREFLTQLEEILQKESWHDTAVVMESIVQLQDLANKQRFAGIMLLVDEAGKTLEYALQDRAGGDVYIFQELAEYACRQTDMPILFLISLHQMFDDYVDMSERTLRNEWNKVQERFQSIQFTESAGTTIKLVGAALQRKGVLPKNIEEAIESSLTEIKRREIPLPFGLEFSEFSKMAKQAWPIQPGLLLTMPYLFRRLAQNERSIFSFLNSKEPFAFHHHMRKTLESDHGFIRLHHIYTYLMANFEAGLARLTHAKRLLEANDIINSRLNLSEEQLEIVRSVALLNILSEVCPLRATTQVLKCMVSTPAKLEDELHLLQQQSLLTFRRLDNSYRVWEGSDVDIEARVTEARRKLQLESTSPIETLRQHLPEKNLIARRHSLQTGVRRYFQLRYTESLGSNLKIQDYDFKDAAGIILVALPQANVKQLRADAAMITKENNRIIVALPTQIAALRATNEEVACLRWVEKNTPELRDDRIARRELGFRLVWGEQRIAQLVQGLLDPRPTPAGNACEWFWRGESQEALRPVDVSQLLSTACDHIYHLSPKVRNELVVRTKVSGAASSARRILMERMLEVCHKKTLGIDEFPPERSVYESVLHSTGIHRFDKDKEEWVLGEPPSDNQSNLRPVWDLLTQELFDATIRKVELSELFDKLRSVPYGVPDGLHPLLFVTFYLCHQDELFLYREGTFLPEVESAHFELLQRRADLFAVSGAKLNGVRRAVVERLAKGLKRPAKTAAVVRALYQVLNSLPEITKKTSQIKDSTVLGARNAMLQADSPERLLFEELPICFGLAPFVDDREREQDTHIFFKQLNKTLQVLGQFANKTMEQAKATLLSHCGIDNSSGNGWQELEERAAWLTPRTKHEVLTPLLNCINNGAADNHNAQPTLAFIANRPFEQWSDMDIVQFDGLARGVGELFQQTWQNYDSFNLVLNKDETRQKDALRQKLEQQLETMKGAGSSQRIITAALRELLYSLEGKLAK